MRPRAISIIAGIYLLACIALGGSAQGVWRDLILQIGGVLLIVLAASLRREDEGRVPLLPVAVLLCGLVVILLQLIPLPPSVWTKLPGRAEIVSGLAALHYPLVAMPISEAPFQTTLALFAAIPAIAIFVAGDRLRPSARVLALAIVVAMVGSIFLGAVQVAGGSKSPAYLYDLHSSGAVGFFANQNHMATLLLVGIPMGAALVVSAKSNKRKSAAAWIALGAAFFLLCVVGIALNGSRAAVGLSLPVIVASVALFPAAARWRTTAIGLAIVALLGGVALIMSNPINSEELEFDGSSQALTRGEIWRMTGKAIEASFPVGTGLGSFEQVYRGHENPLTVSRSYVNHAHNDYLELVLELGLAGALLLAIFIAWWASAAVRIWSSAFSSPFERAATIATAAILAHSAVDFPLRTAAISAIFGACLAMMTQHLRADTEVSAGEARPTRHVSLG